MDAGNPATDVYDLQFRLLDALVSGNQVGTTIVRDDVTVTSGVLSVMLDFGATAFPGPNRFLEIGVRSGASVGAFTALSPVQPLTSTPYAIRSLDASAADGLSLACVNCVTSSQINNINGSQISGAILTASVPDLGASYIKNTAAAQAGSNFSISGNGTAGGTISANAVNATTQYSIGSSRVLSIGSSSTFLGVGAGQANTSGSFNTFFGTNAGQANTIGFQNTFFGTNAGLANTADHNAFFGDSAGMSNTTGFRNAFFGGSAGSSNTMGSHNAFFGPEVGMNNLTGYSNSFFGDSAGALNTSGFNNSFFGNSAGHNNVSGNGNAFFGYDAGYQNTGGANSIFGAYAGQVNTTGGSNTFIGHQAGTDNTSGSNNSYLGFEAGGSNTMGSNNTFVGSLAGGSNIGESNNTFIGYQANGVAGITNSTAIGANAFVAQSNSLVLGSGVNVGIGTGSPSFKLDIADRMRVRQGPSGTAGIWLFQNTPNANQAFVGMLDDTRVGFFGGSGGGWSLFADTTTGVVTINSLGASGSTPLCRNASNQIGPCSSSLRYKTNIASFDSGLNLVSRLHPIAFDWKDSGARDIGFGAEEVEKVEPLLTFRNDKGEIEGVKYNQLSAVFVNAFQEQQAQIQQEQQQIRQQQNEIEVLKELVCLDHANAEVCKAEKKP